MALLWNLFETSVVCTQIFNFFVQHENTKSASCYAIGADRQTDIESIYHVEKPHEKKIIDILNYIWAALKDILLILNIVYLLLKVL